MKIPKRILISRSDAIGDVILTLPLASILKQKFPGVFIGFLGKNYTRAVIECCCAVDEFVDVEEFLKATPKDIAEKGQWDAIIHVFPRADIARKAKQARIPWRIGTSSRLYNWLYCNKFVKLNRKNSNLHEAQLNAKLLRSFGIDKAFSIEELGRLFSFDKIPPLPEHFQQLLAPGKQHIILHPKSQGSAREWGLDNFEALIRLLPKEQFQIFISGTKQEAVLLQPLFEHIGEMVTDISGQMDLNEFIAFIDACDALVAASTGPLHIAAALGKKAIGIYPSIRPMHPGRWAPLGAKAVALSLKESCELCRKEPSDCSCIQGISAERVVGEL
ncbi:MAG: glycosyltransferase family 9 protein [Chitinophagaceae bacterium]